MGENQILYHTDLSAAMGGPSPRAAHSCDAVGDFLVIFGGWYRDVALGDAFAYHTNKKRWYALNLLISQPRSVGSSNSSSSKKKSSKNSFTSLARNNHVSCVYRQELYIHGGHDGEKWLSDMFAIDVSCLEDLTSGLDQGGMVDVRVRLIEQHGRAPTKRACHAMCIAGGCFYFFGGYDGSQCFNDLEMFDPATSNWTKLSKPNGKKPPPRNAHSLLSDGKHLYLAGGHSGKDHFDDVYIYTIATHTWTNVKLTAFIPPAVRGHGACLFREEMYMFGGYNGSEPFNTLYVFNIQESVWRIVPITSELGPIVKRQRNTLVTLGNNLYIFGGFNGHNWMNDLHSLHYQAANCKLIDGALLALSDNLSEFVNNEMFSDATIKVSDSSIPVHSVLLAANSTYFKSLFLQERESDVIELCGWSFDAVLKMIEFIYTSRIKDFNNSTHFKICELLGLADSVKLTNLKTICEDLLIRKIDVDNTCYLLKYSQLYNANNLRQRCFDFIGAHAADVMRTPGFDDLSSVPSLVLELAKLSISK